MSQGNGQSAQEPVQYILNRKLIAVSIQVGCLTLLIILASLVVGVWLDRQLETMPLFTILLLVGSMPVTWVAIFWVVNRAKKHFEIHPASMHKAPINWEEADSDRD